MSDFMRKSNYNLIRVVLAVCLIMLAGICMFSEYSYAGSRVSFRNKKIFIAGDSIQNKARNSKYGAFIHRACKKLKAKDITNMAKSDATLANVRNDKVPSVLKQIIKKKKHLKEYDYFFISAGTNDYGGFNIGYASVDKMKKDLKKIIRYIHKKNRKAKIIIVTPIYRYSYRGFVDCEITPNHKGGHTLREYRAAINEITRKKKYKKYVLTISGTKLVEKRRMKSPTYTWDRIHPTLKCAKTYLIPNMVKQIRKHAKFFRK